MSGNIVEGNVLYANTTGNTGTDSGIIGANVLSAIESYGTAGTPTIYSVSTDISLDVGATYNAGAYSTLELNNPAAVALLTNFQIGAAISLPGGGSVPAGNGTLEFGSGLAILPTSTLTFYGGNDTLILDSGNNTPLPIAGFAATDSVVFKSVNFVAGTHVVSGGNAITGYYDQVVSSGGTVLATVHTTTHLPASDFGVVDVGGKLEFTFCFLAGTHIRTPLGEVAVESLQVGDEVLTAEGRAMPVRWLGINTIATRFADPLRFMPIRVRAGALGGNLPLRDLLISPDHALLVDGVLIHANALVNGLSITRETSMPETFKYYHVELADHSLILAEGAAAETFIDNVDRMAFDNWEQHQALYGDEATLQEMAYPRAKSARQMPKAVKARLLALVEEPAALAA